MKPKSLAVNAFLNGIRNVINLLFPLITFPYVSRVLGVSELGKYNFSTAFVSYFLLIAALGINTYAIREGAKYRDDRSKMSKFASQMFTINLYSTIISYLLLIATLFIFRDLDKYKVCILILSLQLFFTTIGTEWLYSIFEEYTYITIRSILFKILSLVLLLIFVRQKGDYLNYAIVTVVASVGSNILNFFHVKTFCELRIARELNLKEHIVPILTIFASNIAIMIYVNSDVTLLGLIKSDYVVGIYTVSVKIYTVVKNMLAAALIVTIPRLAMLYGKGMMDKYKDLFMSIFHFLLMICLPAMVGLTMLSHQIVLIMSGENYIRAVSSLRILSIALICSIFTWLYSDCVLIPSKKEKKVLIFTIICAITNLALNLMLIPFFSENASAFSTLMAEGLNMFMCVREGRKIVTIRVQFSEILGYIIGCLGIVMVCMVVSGIIQNPIINVAICVGCSSIVYFLTLCVFKNNQFLALVKKIMKR